LRVISYGVARKDTPNLENNILISGTNVILTFTSTTGSGCTTFLKTIANQRFGFSNISGEVLYGPFTAKEFKKYRGEAVYNQEDDVHHATLVRISLF